MLPQKEGIPPSFADHDLLVNTGWVCIYCAACIKSSAGLRQSSFLATPSQLELLKREQIWDKLRNTPTDEPFVFGVSFRHKRHIVFRAPVNLPNGRGEYEIATDDGPVLITSPPVGAMMSTLQLLYDLGLTKEELLYGPRRIKWLTRMDIRLFEKYNRDIGKHRGTLLLKLLVHALNKQKKEE